MGLFDSLKKAAVSKAPPAATPTPEPPKAKSPAPVPDGQPSPYSAQSGLSAPSPGRPRHLLFVGGDELWLGQTQRDLTCLQANWKCELAPDCGQAVEKWAGGSFDTLVLDSKVADGAKNIRFIGYFEKWTLATRPDYKQQVSFFDFACQELIRQAEAKNLEGTTLAYLQFTASCVQCHKVMRDARK